MNERVDEFLREADEEMRYHFYERSGMALSDGVSQEQADRFALEQLQPKTE